MSLIARAIARKAICAPFEVRTTTLPLSARVSLRTSLTTGAAHHLVASSAAMTTIGATISATTAVMTSGAIAGLGAIRARNRAETSHLLVGRLASVAGVKTVATALKGGGWGWRWLNFQLHKIVRLHFQSIARSG